MVAFLLRKINENVITIVNQQNLARRPFFVLAGNFLYRITAVIEASKNRSTKSLSIKAKIENTIVICNRSVHHFISTATAGKGFRLGFEGKAHSQDITHCFAQSFIASEMWIGVDVCMHLHIHIIYCK